MCCFFVWIMLSLMRGRRGFCGIGVVCLIRRWAGFRGRGVDVWDGARGGGEPAVLAPLPVQYADFAVWQRAWLTGEVLERQLGFWRDRLAGASVLELPTDRPRPAIWSPAGAV